MTLLRMRSLLCASLLFVALPSHGAKPSKFSSVPTMMSSLNDYTQENGTFKTLRRDPLHIQVSPMVFPGDFPDVIDAEVKRAVIYGIYRSFIHTPVDKITVTAIPKELNPRTKSSRYLGAYKRTVTKTRREALDLIRRYLHVSTFDALVEDQHIGGSVVSDVWTKAFNRLYYEDQGPPGLMTFYSELEK
ncbi:MAG TPA: hypothetical protein VGP73_06305 [Thermoanaerobaculia bacterium]